MGENGGSSKALGQSIQKARQIAGLTQQELCQRTGLSYSTLAKIERGAIKTPSVFTVFKISKVLGIGMDDLLGAVVDEDSVQVTQKRVSKNGVSFVFFDVNGCLVRFFHTAFSRISSDTGIPSDVVESAFWHFNDAVCRGEMTMDEFNNQFAKRLGLAFMDWADYYLSAIEPIGEMHELVRWASDNYRIGLLTNIMPGLVEKLIGSGKLPNVKYDVIIDSSEVNSIKPEAEIYDIAQGRAEVNPSEILFIDDSRTNLMSAERLGWKVLWFDVSRPEESARRIRSALD